MSSMEYRLPAKWLVGLAAFLVMAAFALAGGLVPGSTADVGPRIEINKTVEVENCHTGQVDLYVRGEGEPIEERKPLDVMLVLDRSGSMQGQPIVDAKIAAELLVDELDSTRDKVGLVSYSDTASLNRVLTSDFDSVKTAIDGLTAEGFTNIGDAVFDAQAELNAHGRSDAVHIMLVLSDGVANRSHGELSCATWPSSPTPCTNDAINQAAAAKAAGTIIFTIGLNFDNIEDDYGPAVANLARTVLQAMASGAGNYYEAPDSSALAGIFNDIATTITTIAGEDVIVIEVLPPHVHYVPGSAVPAPASVVGQALTWELDLVSIGDEHHMSFQVIFDYSGDDLLMDELVSRVEYLDFLGHPQTQSFQETRRDVPDCPHIIIDKVTDPPGDLQSFQFTLTGGPSALNQAFSLTDASAPHDSGDILPGSGYNAAEVVPLGWNLSGATCDNGSPVNNVSVGPTERVTCTFTNTLRRGTIIVEKQTDPNGAAGSFTYTGDAAGSIGDNGQIVVGGLLPGTYSSTEADPTAAGFDLTGIVCNDTDSSGNVGTRTATFHLGAGETVKCTFTNTLRRGTIIVEKQTDPNGAAGSFTYTGDAAGSIGDNGQIVVGGLLPGTYSSTEADPTGAGFDLTGIVCNDTDSSGNVGTRTATFHLGPGETVKCTFTNTKPPKLIVIKHVVNEHGGTAVASNFTMTVTANNPSPASFAGVEAPGTTVSLNAGSYNVTEAGPSGYAAIYVGCTGDIAVGETKTCTITNYDVPPQLIVIKHVINDDGGTADASDFTMTMTVTANEPSPASFPGEEAPGTTVSLKVGDYDVTESGPSGYSASFSADCTGSVTLAETKTCTVTNDDVPRGSIIVEKQTIPGGAAGSFTFTGTAAGSISDNGQIVVTNLLVGTYTSAEVDLPAGFNLSSIVCDDADSANPSSGSVGSGTATFRLDADEVVKCTFTNRLETTPTPTPTPSPTPSPTPTPTETPTETPSPTPTATVTETPPATVPPIVAPETLTPKPTLTATPTATRPPDATPATPAVAPPSGGGATSEGAAWPWLALAAAGGLALILSASLVWLAKERRGQ